MNFVAQLEDYLRDLGAEARNNHPGELRFEGRGTRHRSIRPLLSPRLLLEAFVVSLMPSEVCLEHNLQENSPLLCTFSLIRRQGSF